MFPVPEVVLELSFRNGPYYTRLISFKRLFVAKSVLLSEISILETVKVAWDCTTVFY